MNENQAVCLKCGVAAGAGRHYCPNCGNAVSEQAIICVNCGASLIPGADNGSQNICISGIKPRSLVTAILLSIITCGIYSIYWFVSLTNEMNKASGRANDTSGGAAFLFGLVTCGIYYYFWSYQMGEKRDIVAKESGSSNILYLVLSLFGFGIVVYCLAQHALNNAVERK